MAGRGGGRKGGGGAKSGTAFLGGRLRHRNPRPNPIPPQPATAAKRKQREKERSKHWETLSDVHQNALVSLETFYIQRTYSSPSLKIPHIPRKSGNIWQNMLGFPKEILQRASKCWKFLGNCRQDMLGFPRKILKCASTCWKFLGNLWSIQRTCLGIIGVPTNS